MDKHDRDRIDVLSDKVEDRIGLLSDKVEKLAVNNAGFIAKVGESMIATKSHVDAIGDKLDSVHETVTSQLPVLTAKVVSNESCISALDKKVIWIAAVVLVLICAVLGINGMGLI